MLTLPQLPNIPSEMPVDQVKERIPADHQDALKLIRECSGQNDGHLYAMRASAYTQILYAHGLQSYAYSLTQGRMVDLQSSDEAPVIPLNVILPIVEGQKALLISKQPKRDVYPTTQDDRDIEAAKYASDLLRWLDETLHLEEVASEAADLLVKTGNVFLFDGWDPTGGRFFTTPDGKMIFEGDPIFRAESLFGLAFHPHAKSVDESQYAHHTQYVSRDWVEEHFPKFAKDLPKDDSYVTSSSKMFERALLNLSHSHSMHSGGNSGPEVPHGEGCYELQTLYWRSCPRYPQGRMCMALARGDDPYLLLHDGPNPYIDYATGRRTLPFTHIKLLSVPGRLLGESFVLHAMPHQRVINKTRADLLENAHLFGNIKGYYEQDGIAPETWTNEIGGMMPIAPGSKPPGMISPPEMPMYVVQAEAAMMQFLNVLTAPVGPLQGEDEQRITSGVQQMIVEEAKRQKIAPMVRSWELGFDRSAKRKIDNWRTFQTLPRKIGVMGDANAWRETYFSGQLANANFVVKIEPYSAMPTSRTATFAEWIEIMKAIPQEMGPDKARQFWQDIGKPGMARTYRDNNADVEKALRNITKVRAGQMPPPLWERQDDPEAHVSVYENWMKSGEYEKAKLENPMIEFAMNIMLDSFVRVIQEAQEAQMMQMAALQGAGSGKQQGHPDNGGNVPRLTQGFGKARNPMQNQGGNPHGPMPQ